jgi:hypothetical protein
MPGIQGRHEGTSYYTRLTIDFHLKLGHPQSLIIDKAAVVRSTLQSEDGRGRLRTTRDAVDMERRQLVSRTLMHRIGWSPIICHPASAINLWAPLLARVRPHKCADVMHDGCKRLSKNGVRSCLVAATVPHKSAPAETSMHLAL